MVGAHTDSPCLRIKPRPDTGAMAPAGQLWSTITDMAKWAGFLADLQSLAPSDQLRHAVGVLSQTLALRAALGPSPTRAEEAAMTMCRQLLANPVTEDFNVRVIGVAK